MNNRIVKFAGLAFLLVSFGLIAGTVAAQNNGVTQAKIASAMSAGPLIIAQDATIEDTEVDANGKPIVLRAGKNGWICNPDSPASPGNDPICYDKVWQAWFDAAAAGKKPNEAVTVPGFAYMYQGGSHASMTDPTLAEPPAGKPWMSLPPHIMIALPAGVDISGIGTDPTSGNAWVMFPHTPFEVILVPVGGTTGMMGMAPPK